MTPHIFLEPNGGGYNVGVGEGLTNLPDGYVQVAIFGKYGDATVASLTTAELVALRDCCDQLLDN